MERTFDPGLYSEQVTQFCRLPSASRFVLMTAARWSDSEGRLLLRPPRLQKLSQTPSSTFYRTLRAAHETGWAVVVHRTDDPATRIVSVRLTCPVHLEVSPELPPSARSAPLPPTKKKAA